MRVAAGDVAALRALYDEHAPRAMAIALQILRSLQEGGGRRAGDLPRDLAPRGAVRRQSGQRDRLVLCADSPDAGPPGDVLLTAETVPSN